MFLSGVQDRIRLDSRLKHAGMTDLGLVQSWTQQAAENESEGDPMSTISKDNKVVTLINVFTVGPENQQRLVDVLLEATEKTMKHLPGFVSAQHSSEL